MTTMESFDSANLVPTVSCEQVYSSLQAIRERADTYTREEYTAIDALVRAAADAFTDFECAWLDHAAEYHGA